ncbi:hypothetical protein SRRS_35810 [Sporomusa rhizae]
MPTNTTDQLYYALSRLSRLIHRMEHRIAHGGKEGHKFHRGQSRVLSILAQTNDASQRDIAEILDVRPSSMTEMLLRMEQSGLISRRQDENDQRIMRISLTESGKQAAAQSTASTHDVTAALFKSLAAEEQSQLLALIDRVNASLETMENTEDHHPGHHGSHDHHGHHGHHDHHCHHHSHGRGHHSDD